MGHCQHRNHPDLKIAPAINAVEARNCRRFQPRPRQGGGVRGKARSGRGLRFPGNHVEGLQGGCGICLIPNSLHCQHTLQAAEAGKHVLAEKPMSTTLEDAVAMVRGCRDKGVKLGTGYHLRTHPGHIMAEELISSGVWAGWPWRKPSGGSASAAKPSFPPGPGCGCGGTHRKP